MNKQLKSMINKHAHKSGAIHAFKLKQELLARAAPMERSGMPLQAIISELGISAYQPDNFNASQELK